MKILITGGLGFIGSNLAQGLIKKGHKVTIIDNFMNFMGNKFDINLDYRYKLVRSAKIIRGKSSNIKLWENQYDVVVHLAGIPVINPKTGDFYKNNVQETQLVLRNASLKKVQKFIFMSSIYAYGTYKGKPYSEEDSLEPIDGYGISKAIGEFLTRYYFYDRDWVIIRTAGVYGFGDHNARISRLITECWEDLGLKITKNIYRNFIYVSDLVEGMIKAIEKDKLRGAFNLVTDTIMLQDYAKEVQKHIPNLKYKLRNCPAEELIIGPVNINKARRALNFKPKYPLKKGIEDYLKKIQKYS